MASGTDTGEFQRKKMRTQREFFLVANNAQWAYLTQTEPMSDAANLPPPIPPVPPVQPPPESQVRTWNMLCHLSALLGLLGIPFGNVLGPLIVWQIKKSEIPSVEVHGKAAVNFQLTIAIAAIVTSALGFVLTFMCIGVVLFIVAGGIFLCGLIFALIAGIKANEGQDYKYPYSLDLIK
jgi:uncharacterized Tic20 family protein